MSPSERCASECAIADVQVAVGPAIEALADARRERVIDRRVALRALATQGRPVVATLTRDMAQQLQCGRAMFSLRAVVHAGAVLCLTAMSGCGPVQYGGDRCNAITLSTDPASLPLGGRVAVSDVSFQQVQPFIKGTGELGCCVSNAFFSERADCAAVDCEALRARLTVAAVLGPYVNEPCGRQADVFSPREGAGTCQVFLEGETIVGVRASCLD